MLMKEGSGDGCSQPYFPCVRMRVIKCPLNYAHVHVRRIRLACETRACACAGSCEPSTVVLGIYIIHAFGAHELLIIGMAVVI